MKFKDWVTEFMTESSKTKLNYRLVFDRDVFQDWVADLN